MHKTRKSFIALWSDYRDWTIVWLTHELRPWSGDISRGRLDLAVLFTSSTPNRQNRNQVHWNNCAGVRRSTPSFEVVYVWFREPICCSLFHYLAIPYESGKEGKYPILFINVWNVCFWNVKILFAPFPDKINKSQLTNQIWLWKVNIWFHLRRYALRMTVCR